MHHIDLENVMNEQHMVVRFYRLIFCNKDKNIKLET